MGPGRLRGQRQRGNHERENPWHKTFAGSGHAGRAGLFLDSGGALFRRPADHHHRLPVSGGDVHGAVRLCGAGRGDPDGRHQRPAAAAAGGGRADQRRRRGGAGLRGPGDAGPPEGDPIPPYPDRTVAVRGGGGRWGRRSLCDWTPRSSRRSATTGALWRRTGWTRRRTAEPSCGAW